MLIKCMKRNQKRENDKPVWTGVTDLAAQLR